MLKTSTRFVPRTFAAAWLLAAMPATAAAQLIASTDLPLAAADGTAYTVTRGLVRVPELRGDSEPRTIDLAFVRIRRAGVEPNAAHVVLAGGPGDSGVNLALGIARQGGAAMADVMGGDIIGIDQRGTGASVPNLSSDARYLLPLDRPGSPEEWLPVIARTIRGVAADFRSRGVRLEAYNTRESADDVADVCRALGYRSVTVWGRSYGSHLALATLRQHPTLVSRLVLVSPEGPDHTWKLPSQTSSVLDRVSKHTAFDFRGALSRVLDQLTVRPAIVATVHPLTKAPQTIAIGPFDIQWMVVQALGDPRTLATLPAALREMSAGNFERVAQTALVMRERFGVQSAMKHVMDARSGGSEERRARILREAAAAPLGNALNFPGFDVADAWRVAPLDDDFRRPVVSDVHALLLVGDIDVRTPVENAREIAATLPNAQVVVLENTAHQFDLFGSEKMRTILKRFLRGQNVSTR
jgi:pimeloyl-ACP methyl ester carboxylesterase